MRALLAFDLFDLTRWEGWIAPAVGLGCALLAIFLGRLVWGGERPAKASGLLLPPPPKPSGPQLDSFLPGSPGERRDSLRGSGNPVVVLISDAEAQAKPFPG